MGLRSLAAAFVALAVVTFLFVTVGGGERVASPDALPQPPPLQAPQPVPLEGGVGSRLADAVVELDPATFDPSPNRGHPAPLSLGLPALGIDAAPVLAVGVDERGALAVPGPAEVGWYRYGPAPGEPGATVLAAHVAYDGVDGVFRHLADLDVGDEVVVSTDDGALRSYRVSSVSEHPKDALPAEVWARTGPSRLVLITCGGSFDAERRSYDRNVVVWAVPA